MVILKIIYDKHVQATYIIQQLLELKKDRFQLIGESNIYTEIIETVDQIIKIIKSKADISS